MAKERIGILGGTFNPIHEGHIAMARAALQNAHLDRVLILPDGSNTSFVAPAMGLVTLQNTSLGLLFSVYIGETTTFSANDAVCFEFIIPKF